MVGGIGGRLSNSIQAHCTLVYVTRRHRAIIATIISESRMNRGLSPPSPASLTHSFSPSCRVLQVGTHVPLSRGLGLVGCPQWRPRFSEPRPPSGGFGRVAPRPGSACWSLGREGKKNDVESDAGSKRGRARIRTYICLIRFCSRLRHLM